MSDGCTHRLWVCKSLCVMGVHAKGVQPSDCNIIQSTDVLGHAKAILGCVCYTGHLGICKDCLTVFCMYVYIYLWYMCVCICLFFTHSCPRAAKWEPVLHAGGCLCMLSLKTPVYPAYTGSSQFSWPFANKEKPAHVIHMTLAPREGISKLCSYFT